MTVIELMSFFGRDIVGIIHIGANIGQERELYRNSGAVSCIYVEPAPEAFRSLEENIADIPGHIAVNAVCASVSGTPVLLNIADNGGESSSLLPLGHHGSLFPNVGYVASIPMVTRTLDEIVQTCAPGPNFNVMVIDAQGFDLEVLKGSIRQLPKIDGVFVEVSEVPLYKGGCIAQDITNFLLEFGFFMKWMQIGRYRYGDAFYLRHIDPAMLETGASSLALNMPATQSSHSVYSSDNDAQGANNGVRTGRYGFHTDFEKDPWWQVDLGGMQEIREIRIFNRLDVCSDRARWLKVLTSIDGEDWKQLHAQSGRPFGGVDGRPLRIYPTGFARFVRVQLEGTDYLHLDQVEVY